MFLRPRLNLGRPKAGGGGLPRAFAWNPEVDGAGSLPGTSTFVRSSGGGGGTAWYRNGSGVWVSVGANVIRDAHNAIPGGGAPGYLPETTATKLALFPRDLTNGVWSATNITPAKDATGIDSIANSASTLTATAGNGTIFQSFTRASSAHSFACFVARKTGTGTVEITIDGGTTWIDITSSLTASIDNPFVVTQTLANPSIGFRLGTSGDEIEVDMADLEATAYATTPLDHTSSTALRNGDALTDVTWPTEHSAFCDATVASTLVSGASNRCHTFGASANKGQYLEAPTFMSLFSGSFANVIAGTSRAGERHKFAYSWESGSQINVDDEGGSNTSSDVSAAAGPILIGHTSGPARQFRGVIHNMIVYSVTQTQSELEALVA